MNSSPQPLFLVCEVPLKDALAIGATSAGRFAHLLSTPDMEAIRGLNLHDTAEPFITIDPDSHVATLELEPWRGIMTSLVTNHVIPALKAIKRADQELADASARNEAAIRAFLEAHATPHLLERFNAGVLPPDELATAIRDTLFHGSGDLEEAPRFRRLQVEDFLTLRRASSCSVTGGRHGTTFEVFSNVVLDPAEYNMIYKYREAAKTVRREAAASYGMEHVTSTLETREHVMRCPHQGCSATVRRKSVMVTFTWAGITVGRELAL